VPGTAPTLSRAGRLVRLIKETPEGRIMGAKAKGMFDEKQKRLDDMQEDVKKRIEAFKRERGSLSPEAVAKGEASFQQEVTRIQSVYKTYQKGWATARPNSARNLSTGRSRPTSRTGTGFGISDGARCEGCRLLSARARPDRGARLPGPHRSR